MSDEIERMVALAEAGLGAMASDSDHQTAVSDAIANLLIFAHERDLEVAGAFFKGAAQYVATYLEPLGDDDATDWLHENLFPFSGEQSADFYIGRDALRLAGKDDELAPEFGV